MRTELLRMALMGTWVLAVVVFGYTSGTTSVAGWTLLAAIALGPPLVMTRFWSTPAPTMSEAIRKVLR